jgi:hypothetical protein
MDKEKIMDNIFGRTATFMTVHGIRTSSTVMELSIWTVASIVTSDFGKKMLFFSIKI